MDREVNNNDREDQPSGDQQQRQQSTSSSQSAPNKVPAETSCSATKNSFSIETILCKDDNRDPRTTVIYSTKGIHQRLPSWKNPQLSTTGDCPPSEELSEDADLRQDVVSTSSVEEHEGGISVKLIASNNGTQIMPRKPSDEQ